jgi:hypothetical protein
MATTSTSRIVLERVHAHPRRIDRSFFSHLRNTVSRTSVNCLVYPLGVEESNVAFATAEGTTEAPRLSPEIEDEMDTRRRTASVGS